MVRLFYFFHETIRKMPASLFSRILKRANLTIARSVIKLVYSISKPSRNPFDYENTSIPEVIVSLTTYGKRARNTRFTIESILRQTYSAKSVIIWIAEDDDEAIQAIRRLLRRYENFNLEMRICKDIKSHKKFVYCIQEFPNEIIVTVDDDIIYHPNMLEVLVNSYRLNQDSIICMRAHEITYSGGMINSYNQWKKCIDYESALGNNRVFFTSGGGTLFPPGSLPAEAFDTDAILKLAPYADDIWLNCMVRLKGTSIIKAKDSPRDVITIREEKQGLASVNVNQKLNDQQLKQVVAAYNIPFEAFNE